MSSIRELRTRIRSIKNISQITKAMQMVAATKMRKAQIQALASRPYNQTLVTLLLTFLQNNRDLSHPLLLPKDSTKSLEVLFSTDKSLCGSLNTNLFRHLQNQPQLNNSDFITMGAKGRNFISKTGKSLLADFPNQEKIDLPTVRQIRQLIVKSFLDNQYSAVYLTYSNFINTLRQEPTTIQVLPIQIDSFLTFLNQAASQQSTKTEFIVEPNLAEILEYSLIHYLDISIYQAIYETKASEHSARMMAMQNATDNAQELVSDLTLAYNQTRQEAITTELLEITSAGAALQ